jgi:hypothetical protein
MFYFAEHLSYRTRLGRLSIGALLSFGVAVMAVGLYRLNPAALDGAGLVTFILLFGACALFTRQFSGDIEIGGELVVAVGAYISLGGSGAVLVIYSGTLLSELVRLPTWQQLDLKRHTVLESLIAIPTAAGLVAFSTLLAGAVVHGAGATVSQAARWDRPVPATVIFFGVLIAAHQAAVLGSIALAARSLSPKTLRRFSLQILPFELLVIPAGFLLGILYQNLNALSFAGVVVIFTAVLFLLRLTDVSRARLQQRVEELAVVNAFGQTLSSRLSMDELLAALYRSTQTCLSSRCSIRNTNAGHFRLSLSAAFPSNGRTGKPRKASVPMSWNSAARWS